MKVFFAILLIFEALLAGGLVFHFFSAELISKEDSLIYLFHRFLWGNFIGLPPLLFILFFVYSLKGSRKNKGSQEN